MRIGIIGAAGGQGRKFLKLCLECNVDFILYDHHGEISKIDNIACFQTTNSEKDLLKCEGVIIASPNESHIQYIQYLISNNYCGYIYCEKPPVCNIDDLNYLSCLDENQKKRMLFGFNLERSLYKDILNGKYHIGRLLYCNIISGHGLGFKQFYKDSWRNDIHKCKNGIFEMVSIHYLEMFIAQYGYPKTENSFSCVKAPGGINIDNNLYTAVWGDEEIMLNLYVSYTSPLIEKSDFIFDDGYISVTENETTIYAPRDCFNKAGMFRQPDILTQIPMGTDKIWENALLNNFKYFIEKIKYHDTIPVLEFENAINVNRYILSTR